MENQPERKVRYNQTMGTLLLVGGLINLVLGLMTGMWQVIVVGICCFTIGLLYTSSPMITYDDRELRVKNPLGGVQSRHALEKGSVEFQRNRIYINGKRLPVATSSMPKKDRSELLEFLRQYQATESADH